MISGDDDFSERGNGDSQQEIGEGWYLGEIGSGDAGLGVVI